MQHTTIAVDLAKSVFQVAISHRPGRVDEEHRLSRGRFLSFFADRPAATVLLEACGSAHHWSRALKRLGHTVRLLPPHDVRRYVRRNKTDRADAKALLEAARNEEIHAVPVKSEDAAGHGIPPPHSLGMAGHPNGPAECVAWAAAGVWGDDPRRRAARGAPRLRPHRRRGRTRPREPAADARCAV